MDLQEQLNTVLEAPKEPDDELKTEGADDEPKKDETDSKWDTERQRADQNAANFRKERERSDKLEAELSSTKDTISELQSKLKEFADSKELSLDEIDPDIIDPSVLKTLKSFADKLKTAHKELSEVNRKIKVYEESEAQKLAKAEKEAVKEKILSPLDTKYGAKYRNDALKLADRKVAELGRSPADILEARDLMETCYQEVKDKAESDKTNKSKTTVDNGHGGTALNFDNIGTGSRQSVLAAMKKNGVFKNMKMPSHE